jgi:hypothetical protein
LAEPVYDLANVACTMTFGEGRELIVNIQVNPRGTNDVYVDNIIPLTVGLPGTDNTASCASAALLAIHATTRECH